MQLVSQFFYNFENLKTMSSSDLSVMTNEILTVLVAKAIEETSLRLIYDEHVYYSNI